MVGMRRIYFLYSELLESAEDWKAAISHASSLRFDTVAVRLPRQNLFNNDAAPGLTIQRLAALARSNKLRLGIDLRIDVVAAGSDALADLGIGTGASALNPRLAPEDRSLVSIPFQNDAVAHRWLQRVEARFGELRAAGVDTFLCGHPDRAPPNIWARTLAAARGGKEGTQTNASFILCPAAITDIAAHREAAFDAALLPVASILEAGGFGRLDSAPGLPIFFEPETPYGLRSADMRGGSEIVHRSSKRALETAAQAGDGFLVPMGFEYGATRRVPATSSARDTWATLRNAAPIDLTKDIAALDDDRDAPDAPFGAPRVVQHEGDGVRIITRMARDGGLARVILANCALDRAAMLPTSSFAPEIGAFLPVKPVGQIRTPNVDGFIALPPGEVRVLEGRRSSFIEPRAKLDAAARAAAIAAPRLVIEAVTPAVDDGAFPIKRTVGATVRVEADAYGEGHDEVCVALLWRAADATDWRETRMRPLGNDRFSGEFLLERIGRYVYTVEAWRDSFGVFQSELNKKADAGVPIALELQEGQALIERRMESAPQASRADFRALVVRLEAAREPERLALLLSNETARLMQTADPREFRLRAATEFGVVSERKGAEFASWYELFPRSQSGDAYRHGTFDDVAKRLPAIRDMGFDVVYFPPIHPIGAKNRKGRNNSLVAAPDDPGSPYAIGAPEGGHDAIHPQLGTVDDFKRLVETARDLDLDIALDFAIQTSPDHPWLSEHPEWFDWRPDGSIRYAENPPKKYEDIVNVDFYAEGARPSLWATLRNTILLWVQRGVKTFRVDNPHTKPFPFWRWVIDEVTREHPDVIFLSEAFTRPKVMYRLAKIGFSQSYTYFTWRDSKYDLTQYLTELTTEPPKEFFRPHFFVNTHDINPDFLQNAPRSAFLIRAALATTLSGLWGMYNGFELCEGRPDAKKKEYADSEKYEVKAWDWDRPGNIIREISMLNFIRRDNPALQTHLGLAFHVAWNDNILYFEKATANRDNVVLAAISLDPHHAQEADVEIPLWNFGLPDHGAVAVEDLCRGHRFTWTGKMQRIRLDPFELPFSIWRLSRTGGA